MILRTAFLLSLVLLSEQLGKSDRTRDEEVEEEESEDPNFSTPSLQYPQHSVSKETILGDHAEVNFKEGRTFTGPALAYVTPWNNKGYDLAKWTSDKLTHVSPVWLQLKPQTADMSTSCRILGGHDIDHDWMADLKKNNSDLKIVPRVLFDQWPPNDLKRFLEDEAWSKRCLDDLVRFLTRNQFDGAVVELWMYAMGGSRGEAVHLLMEMFNQWGDGFHDKNLEIIVPVGPPLNEEHKVNGIFTPYTFQKLINVDYIQIMTYDFPAKHPSGIAPYHWVDFSVDSVLDGSSRMADRLMLGINFYGYKYTNTGVDAINYNQFLEALEDENSELEWDDTAKEHFLKNKQQNYIIYYPSLTSIELRLKIAEKYGVGAAIWDYGQGLNYFTNLL